MARAMVLTLALACLAALPARAPAASDACMDMCQSCDADNPCCGAPDCSCIRNPIPNAPSSHVCTCKGRSLNDCMRANKAAAMAAVAATTGVHPQSVPRAQSIIRPPFGTHPVPPGAPDPPPRNGTELPRNGTEPPPPRNGTEPPPPRNGTEPPPRNGTQPPPRP